jgi:predicted lipoprotein with Yx(FWY)xxD motif
MLMFVRVRCVQILTPILLVLASAMLLGCSTTPKSTPTPAATAAVQAPATATATPTAAATATTAATTTVKVAQVGAANALVEAKGLTLYVFKNDTAGNGKSACTGGCASTWPALTVSGTPTKGSGISGDLGTITSDDGTTQVTYKGQPLYRFAADAAPGDAKGSAINNWSVATP